MIAYAYARYSTDRQSETSITDQLRACREHAARAGLTIVGDFSDEGISGAAMGNRPALQRVLATLERGQVLLVADLSRLSRSQELAPLLDRLRFRGVRVVGVLDGFDSESPQARMQAGLSGIMSDELRASIRARTHLALESRAKTGRATGGRAYGYTPGGEPVADEARIIREVFTRVAEGEPMKGIAADLNRRGVPSPGASWKRAERTALGRWQISALHELLGNERYIGRVVWNRSRWVKDPDSGKRVRRERPRSEWIVTEGYALVDAETWATVQRMRSGRTAFGGGRGGGPKYLLSGILRCGECGAPLVVTGSGGSHYYCSTHRTSGEAACTMALGVARDVAEDVLLAPVERLLLSEEAVEYALELMRRWKREKRTTVTQEAVPAVHAIEAELTELREISAARPALAALRATVADCEDRLAAAKRQAQRGWRAAAGMADEGQYEHAYRAHAARMRTVLQEAGAPARALLREVVRPVRCSPEPGLRYLMADGIDLDPTPLVRAAGAGMSNGSGGVIPIRVPGPLPLLRVA